MGKLLTGAVAALFATALITALAGKAEAAEGITIPKQDWSFSGPFGIHSGALEIFAAISENSCSLRADLPDSGSLNSIDR